MTRSSISYVIALALSTDLTILLYPGGGPPYDQSVSGKLIERDTGDPISGRAIDLYINGIYQRSEPTFPDGSYAFFGIAVTEGTFTFEVRFAGDGTYDPSSASVTATFAKSVTALSIDVSPTTGVPPLDVTISGVLTRVDMGAGLPGKAVNLYRNGVLVASATTGMSPVGQYSFVDTLTSPGTFEYYAEFLGDDLFQGCDEGS